MIWLANHVFHVHISVMCMEFLQKSPYQNIYTIDPRYSMKWLTNQPVTCTFGAVKTPYPKERDALLLVLRGGRVRKWLTFLIASLQCT